MSSKSYNRLTDLDKKQIIEYYYTYKDDTFSKLAERLSVSKRAITRVLREFNINTKRKNRYTLNENYFNQVDTEAKAYILGFIYADGFVGSDKYNNVVISSIDKEILEKIKCEMNFSGEIRTGNKGGFENSKIGYVLNFSSKILTDDLRKIGLYPNKSLTVEYVPRLREDLVRHFIRGYFDGDGSIMLSHNTAYHTVAGVRKKYTYPTFMFDLLGTELMLNEIKRIMNLKSHSLLNTKTQEIKRLACRSKGEAEKIFKYLYNNSTIYMERKYQKWLFVLSAIRK